MEKKRASFPDTVFQVASMWSVSVQTLITSSHLREIKADIRCSFSETTGDDHILLPKNGELAGDAGNNQKWPFLKPVAT